MTADVLATLLADPSRLDALPRASLPDALGTLERLRGEILLRIMQPAGDKTVRDLPDRERASGDQLLTATEVAEILQANTRYVYRHADKWPFTRRLSEGTLRFSRRGLETWLSRR